MGGSAPPSDHPPPSLLFKSEIKNSYQFNQLDGNVSMDSSIPENETKYIQVHIGGFDNSP